MMIDYDSDDHPTISTLGLTSDSASGKPIITMQPSSESGVTTQKEESANVTESSIDDSKAKDDPPQYGSPLKIQSKEDDIRLGNFRHVYVSPAKRDITPSEAFTGSSVEADAHGKEPLQDSVKNEVPQTYLKLKRDITKPGVCQLAGEYFLCNH